MAALGKSEEAVALAPALARATLWYSPARIKNVINEALIVTLQDGREKITYDDFLKAKLLDEIGLQEPVEYTPWEKESVAIHEGGHAIAQYFLTPGKCVQVITIRKRGTALGMVKDIDLEERFTEMDARRAWAELGCSVIGRGQSAACASAR